MNRKGSRVRWDGAGDKTQNFGARPDTRGQRGGGTHARMPRKSILSPDNSKCPLCLDQVHELRDCPKFKTLPVIKRFAITKNSGTCYHCLQRGHVIHDCPTDQDKLCGVKGCTRYEHELIHADSTTNFVALSDWNGPAHGELNFTAQDFASLYFTTFNLARDGSVSLQMVVCKIVPFNGNGLKTVAMLDSCSNMTLIDTKTAIDLDLKILSKPVTRSFNTTNGQAEIETHLVEVPLVSGDGLCTTTVEAYVVKDLAKNTPVVDWSKAKMNLEHLKEVPFEKLPKNPRVTLLIGGEHSDLFAVEEGSQHRGTKGEPVAWHSLLGWTCIGRSTKAKPNQVDQIHSLVQKALPK